MAVGNGLTDSHLPYRVIPNFIPDKVEGLNGDLEAYLSQLPEAGYLLFVGAFGLHKGVDILLQAYGDINTEVPLVLIGYELPEYSFGSANIPPNVFIFKHWPNTAVMEAWRRSNIALIPSKWAEPCPTVVMEAMVTGRPVIGSRIGGIPDIIVDGETGILVPPADPVNLRQAIKQLLDNAELRDRLGQAGQQRVVEFQASSVIPHIEQVYCELVAGGKGREC